MAIYNLICVVKVSVLASSIAIVRTNHLCGVKVSVLASSIASQEELYLWGKG